MGHAISMRKDKNVNKTLGGKPEGYHLEALGIDGRITLKYNSRKQDGRVSTILTWLKKRTSSRLL